MGILLTEAASQTSGLVMTLVMVLVWVGIIYFLMIRPQNKEKKMLNSMIASLEIGDSVLTTSGFYGVIIDITDDTVIVEFGSNKNCRIPMAKTAIAQVEKPEGK